MIRPLQSGGGCSTHPCMQALAGVVLRLTCGPFLLSSFDPLEAQYLALGTLYPGEVGIWWDYLKSNPPLLGGEGWRRLFGEVTDRAFSVEKPGNCSYQLLDEHGANILTQAVSANINLALRTAARDGIARNFLVYSTPELGGPGGGAGRVCTVGDGQMGRHP